MNILLTGKPRVGKTSLIKEIIQKSSLSFGGFYTEEIRKNEKRVGFGIVTLEGKKGLLSHKYIEGKNRVGNYKVNLKDLDEIGVESIRKGLEKNQVVVVDEIGKMELFSEKFRNIILEALDSENVLLGTIMLKPSPFTDKIKEREDVQLIEVDHQNRDSLAERIIKILV